MKNSTRNTILLFCFKILFSNPVNYNLELVSITMVQNAGNNYGISDVWGYTDETGIEYAIFGYRFGTIILDVSTDPENPIEIADIPGPSGGDYYYHRDYKTFNDHLYIVNEMSGEDEGMQIVDLSPLPDNPPIKLNTYTGIVRSHNLWIDQSLGFAFIEHTWPDNIHIVDLTNPGDPEHVGSFQNSYGINCHDVFTQNGIAYVSEGWEYHYRIYDISDLDNLQLLAGITPPAPGYAHNAWVTEDNNFIVTTEETPNKTVKIWDISNLNNIELRGEYLGENNLAHNVHIKGDLVYISHYTTGLKIVDMFNPDDPIEIAAYDTYPEDNNNGYFGCWGAFPFTGNNYVYATDMQHGLFVFEFDPAYAGWLDININSSPDNPFLNGVLVSELNSKIFSQDSTGHFYFGFTEGEQTFDYIVEDEIIETVTFEVYAHEIHTYEFSIPFNGILGDVNLDDTIDILDIISMVNAILGAELSPAQFWAADLNQDGIINVLDIIQVVNIILEN